MSIWQSLLTIKRNVSSLITLMLRGKRKEGKALSRFARSRSSGNNPSNGSESSSPGSQSVHCPLSGREMRTLFRLRMTAGSGSGRPLFTRTGTLTDLIDFLILNPSTSQLSRITWFTKKEVLDDMLWFVHSRPCVLLSTAIQQQQMWKAWAQLGLGMPQGIVDTFVPLNMLRDKIRHNQSEIKQAQALLRNNHVSSDQLRVSSVLLRGGLILVSCSINRVRILRQKNDWTRNSEYV